MTAFRQRRPLTFFQLLARVALFWGVPMTCLDLIDTPWQFALIIGLPGTLAGVITITLVAYWFLSRRKTGGDRATPVEGQK
jgi:hypothetical protein